MPALLLAEAPSASQATSGADLVNQVDGNGDHVVLGYNLGQNAGGGAFSYTSLSRHFVLVYSGDVNDSTMSDLANAVGHEAGWGPIYEWTYPDLDTLFENVMGFGVHPLAMYMIQFLPSFP